MKKSKMMTVLDGMKKNCPYPPKGTITGRPSVATKATRSGVAKTPKSLSGRTA